MKQRNVRLFVSAAVFAGVAMASSADAKCLAPNGEFELGQYSCLATGPNSYLARCENDQNVFSWDRIADYCPGGATRIPRAASASSCRGDGQMFPAGSFACLAVAGQGHLARCDMVLNSPSWTKMQEGCSALPFQKAAEAPRRNWLKKALDLPRGLLNQF